jgi:hypothetical protein
MAQPQGSSLIDTAYFDSLTAQINAINVCSELQAVVNEAFSTLQNEKNAIEAQIEALLPALALLELPTDLGSVISWIGNLVTGLINPIVLPYTNYAAQLIAQAEAIANLVTAIENAASRIESCSITVPPIT